MSVLVFTSAPHLPPPPPPPPPPIHTHINTCFFHPWFYSIIVSGECWQGSIYLGGGGEGGGGGRGGGGEGGGGGGGGKIPPKHSSFPPKISDN